LLSCGCEAQAARGAEDAVAQRKGLRAARPL
jgi:hypothetical protein